MESALARAHRALNDAHTAAELDGNYGAEHDLELLLVEVARVAEHSLKGSAKPARVLNGQMALG